MKANGNGNGREHHTQIPAPSEQPRTEIDRTQVFREISQIKMTSIVSTPARLVDLLEHFDGTFSLRETSFSFGSRASAQLEIIHLQRHELEKLGVVIPRVLEGDESPVPEGKSNGRSKSLSR